MPQTELAVDTSTWARKPSWVHLTLSLGGRTWSGQHRNLLNLLMPLTDPQWHLTMSRNRHPPKLVWRNLVPGSASDIASRPIFHSGRLAWLDDGPGNSARFHFGPEQIKLGRSRLISFGRLLLECI